MTPIFHADHKTGAYELKKNFDATYILGEKSGSKKADVLCKDSEVLPFDTLKVTSRLTPGHTAGCVSFIVEEGKNKWAFTGDTLLIRGCGRTDFQGGDSSTLYRSIKDKLFCLDDDTAFFPGHDYKGQTQSTVGEEKRFNPRLKTSVDENHFVEIMNKLVLKKPNNLMEQVKFNMGA